MSRSSLSNPLALAIMACLWEEPMHPYRITTTLRERGKQHSIRLNFGSLYSVIASLEKHGLIEATRAERAGSRPERTVYSLTEAGRAKTVGWLRELISTPTKEYPDFEAGLSLVMLLPPEETLDLLRRRLERLDTRIEHLAVMAEYPIPEVLLVEGRFELAMVRAERDFVVELTDRMARGALGGQDLWTEMHRRLALGESPADRAREMSGLLRQEGAATPAD